MTLFNTHSVNTCQTKQEGAKINSGWFVLHLSHPNYPTQLPSLKMYYSYEATESQEEDLLFTRLYIMSTSLSYRIEHAYLTIHITIHDRTIHMHIYFLIEQTLLVIEALAFKVTRNIQVTCIYCHIGMRVQPSL